MTLLFAYVICLILRCYSVEAHCSNEFRLELFKFDHRSIAERNPTDWKMELCQVNQKKKTLADLHSKILDALVVQILSISCSFWENLAKLCVRALSGGFTLPPGGNPGSATENSTKSIKVV